MIERYVVEKRDDVYCVVDTHEHNFAEDYSGRKAAEIFANVYNKNFMYSEGYRRAMSGLPEVYADDGDYMDGYNFATRINALDPESLHERMLDC